MTTDRDPNNQPDPIDPLAPEDYREDATSVPPSAAAPSARPSERRRLTRSTTDDWFGGVAGGLADYFDIDPTLVRIAFVGAAIVASGLAIVAYVVGWIIIPEAPASNAPHARQSRGNTGAILAGGILIVGGALLLLSQLDLDIDLPSWEVVLAGALILVGVVMLVEARRGFHGGLITLAVILGLLLGASSVTSFNFVVDGAFGESNHTILRADDLEDDYSHAFGSLTLDLRNLELPPGTTSVNVSVAFGEATVRLREDVPYRIEADSVFGSIEAEGFDTAGIASSRTFTSPGYDEAERRLNLTISAAFGSGRIR